MNIEFLQKFCSSLKGVTEDVKWGNDLCFSVGGKMFCVTSMEPPFKVAFKVPDEVFDELSQSEGIIPAPYMARNKWVMVTKSSVLKKSEWEKYIRGSYDLISAKLTNKLKKELGIVK